MANIKEQFIVKDEWLSAVLKRPAFRFKESAHVVNVFLTESALREEIANLSQRAAAFVYGKVDTAQMAAANFLIRAGFNMVDTNVVFRKSNQKAHSPRGRAEIRFAKIDDKRAVTNLAGRCFKYSRFHLDQMFSIEEANLIKAEWAKNYFMQQRGDAMVVAVIDNEIIGFCQLIYKERETLLIDLIGVDESHRRLSVAAGMISFAQEQLAEFAYVVVGTQLINVPSVHLYEKLGFQLYQSQYVLHYHQKENK